MGSEPPTGFRSRVWLKGVVAGALVGFLAVVLPAVFTAGSQPTEAVFMPIVGKAVSLLTWSIPTYMAYLFAAGLVGTVLSGGPPWLVGLSTMLLFPIWSIVDALMAGPESHTLLGLEFILYAFFTVPAILGAIAGTIIRAIARFKRVTVKIFIYGT